MVGISVNIINIRLMKIVNYFFLYSVISGLFSCGASTSMSGSDNKNVYKEDLSVHRIDYESVSTEKNTVEEITEVPLEGNIQTSSAITEEIDEKLESIAEDNKNKQISGYTIQVYTGNSRETANQTKDMVYRLLPEARPQIQYLQPNYKVKVGKFLDRIEAQKTYTTLKREFPSAMIIPERFTVQ